MSSFAPHNVSAVTSTTASADTVNDYDYDGAAVYIAVILIWYSAGLVLMLFFRVRPRTFESRFLFDYETSGKSASSNAHPFARYHDIQADNVKKQILHELKDLDNRQRLWKIYFASAEKEDEPHAQYYQTITADNITIGRINRKLADIDRMGAQKDKDRDDDLLPLVASPASSESRFDTAKFLAKRFNSRRSSGGMLQPRRPILRLSSQTQPEATRALAQETFATEKNSSPVRAPQRSTRTLRFTVEKVQDDSKHRPVAAENPW